MDVEEVERGGENGGDIMVEEEDQLIDDHLEHENSWCISCSLSITATNNIIHSPHCLYRNYLLHSLGTN